MPLSRSLPIGRFQKDWQELTQLSWTNFTQLCMYLILIFLSQRDRIYGRDNFLHEVRDPSSGTVSPGANGEVGETKGMMMMKDFS